MTSRSLKTPAKVMLLAGLLAIPLSASLLFSLSAPSPETLSTTVEWLSDPSRGGRASGGVGAAATRDYILEEFRNIGLEAELQEIEPGLGNVIGRLGDVGPHILIGAHYDGQGRGYPGASDNAAGIAVLFQLARQLIANPVPVSLVFVAFDDEENGLNGSRHYVANPVYPLEELVATVILDTMGRSFMDLERWTLLVLGTETSPELADVIAGQGDPDIVPLGTDLVGARSDFAPFAARRVPYLFFSNATHQDYHGRGDTPDRIRYDRLDEDAETILRVILEVAGLDSRPTYQPRPAYPGDEGRLLVEYIDAIRSERPAQAESYRLVFDDLRSRIVADGSRESLRLAATVLLAAATPRLSSFSLAYLVGPLYEAEGKPEIAIEVYSEALAWESDRRTELYLRTKLDLLASEPAAGRVQ